MDLGSPTKRRGFDALSRPLQGAKTTSHMGGGVTPLWSSCIKAVGPSSSSRRTCELRDFWVAIGGSLGQATALYYWTTRTSTTCQTLCPLSFKWAFFGAGLRYIDMDSQELVECVGLPKEWRELGVPQALFFWCHPTVCQSDFPCMEVGVLQGGSRCFVGGRFNTLGHFFTTKFFFLRCCFSLEFGAFFGMSKKRLFCEKRTCVFIINGPNRWGFNEKWRYARTDKRTRRCTIHPCTLTPTLTKTREISSIPCTSGSVSQLLVSYFAHQWMRSVDFPSPSPVFIVLNCFELAEHSKADPTIDASHGATASALGRVPHRGGTPAHFSENRAKSLHIVSYLPVWRTARSVIVARGWRLHLEGGIWT